MGALGGLIGALLAGIGLLVFKAGRARKYGFFPMWTAILGLGLFGMKIIVPTAPGFSSLGAVLGVGIGVGGAGAAVGLVIDTVAALTWRRKPRESIDTSLNSAVEGAEILHLNSVALGDDNELYKQISQEIESGSMEKGLWLKAEVLADGEYAMTRVRYAQLRIESLKNSAVEEKIEEQKQQIENWRIGFSKFDLEISQSGPSRWIISDEKGLKKQFSDPSSIEQALSILKQVYDLGYRVLLSKLGTSKRVGWESSNPSHAEKSMRLVTAETITDLARKLRLQDADRGET